MNETTKQIVTTVAAAAAASFVTGLITHYFTQKSTVAEIAKGNQPLPAGATPQFQNANPQGSTPKPDDQNKPIVTPNPSPQPAPQPGPNQVSQLQQLSQQFQDFSSSYQGWGYGW
jgi:hypothetical protein